MGRIAIIGGTGPEGLGLALRLALCGEEIRIGSRQADRAMAAAVKAQERLRAVGREVKIIGGENGAVVDADVVVLAFPHAGVAELLPQLASKLDGKLVIDVVNPLVRRDGLFRLAEGTPSAAEEIQKLIPGASL